MKNPRLCARCGAEIRDPTQDTKLCGSCRLEAKRASVKKERTRRRSGASFPGGPRAWYCPDCRRERAKESKTRIRRTGPVRPLGSVDLCEVCGKPYTVNGSRQRYCPDCAEEAVKAVVRPHKAAYMREDPEQVKAWKDPLRGSRTRCVICRKVFTANTKTNTCSEGCADVLRRWSQAERDWRRGHRKTRPQDPRYTPPVLPRPLTCRKCGVPIPPEEPMRHYCRDCENALTGLRGYYTKTCRDCGLPYFGNAFDSHCGLCGAVRSEELRKEREARNAARPEEERRKIGEYYPCERCGEPYRLNSAPQRYCPVCREERKRPKGTTNVVPPSLVPGLCALCGQSVDRTPTGQYRKTCLSCCRERFREKRREYFREYYRLHGRPDRRKKGNPEGPFDSDKKSEGRMMTWRTFPQNWRGC